MLNKLIFSVLFLLVILGMLIYFRTEFKYSTMANSHSRGLNTKMKGAVTTDEILDTVESGKGLAFSTDFLLGERKLAQLCKPDCLNNAEYYAAYGRLVSNIHPKKLWAFKETKWKDNASLFIYQQEKRKISEELFKNRMYFSDNYKSVRDDKLKAELLGLIKAIDAKIAELKK